jgi:hypothetical protein
MYLKLKCDPVNSFANCHSIPKVPVSVSTAHILTLTATIRIYNLRTDVIYMYKEKFFLIIIEQNQINIYFE